MGGGRSKFATSRAIVRNANRRFDSAIDGVHPAPLSRGASPTPGHLWDSRPHTDSDLAPTPARPKGVPGPLRVNRIFLSRPDPPDSGRVTPPDS